MEQTKIIWKIKWQKLLPKRYLATSLKSKSRSFRITIQVETTHHVLKDQKQCLKTLVILFELAMMD